MARGILIIHMNIRSKQAVSVQKILTKFGCMVKTRLGIHDGVSDKCSDNGLVILELVGYKSKQKELSGKLRAIRGVKVKLVDLPLK